MPRLALVVGSAALPAAPAVGPRVAIAWQNAADDQPPHLNFYLGDGSREPPWRDSHVR